MGVLRSPALTTEAVPATTTATVATASATLGFLMAFSTFAAEPLRIRDVDRSHRNLKAGATK
jgi:hypothetical protein